MENLFLLIEVVNSRNGHSDHSWLIPSGEPGVSSLSPTWVPWAVLPRFPRLRAGSWVEVEQPGLKLACIQDVGAGAVQGRPAGCASVPAPRAFPGRVTGM